MTRMNQKRSEFKDFVLEYEPNSALPLTRFSLRAGAHSARKSSRLRTTIRALHAGQENRLA